MNLLLLLFSLHISAMFLAKMLAKSGHIGIRSSGSLFRRIIPPVWQAMMYKAGIPARALARSPPDHLARVFRFVPFDRLKRRMWGSVLHASTESRHPKLVTLNLD